MSLAIAVAAVAVYALGFKLQLDRLRSAEPAAQISALLPVVAVIAHAYVCYSLVVTDGGISLSLLPVANVLACVIVGVIVFAHFRLPVANLYLFIFPISAVLLLATFAIGPGTTQKYDFGPMMIAHILISLGAYAALMLAALQSMLLAMQEKRLKSHSSPMHQLLPPLETMEDLLIAMLWIGLAFLTGSLLTGWLFIEDMLEQNISHHVVLTTMSWFVYVGFLGGRYLLGWRGTTAVRWTLVAFTLLVLGYFGTKFVLEYILAR